ncbi:MAG: SUMF1/EgtB/PvdO family nonheme iron enzyme [Myxococcota bacterium]
MEDLESSLAKVEALPREQVPSALAAMAGDIPATLLTGGNTPGRLVSILVDVIHKGLGTGRERLAIGELLGRIGDPRLRTPDDSDYWVRVPYEGSTVVIGKYPVTNHEFAAWADAGGYDNRATWSDDGWAWREKCSDPWPINAKQPDADAFVVANQPVVGVTFWEAEAFAAAHGARLPREDERIWVVRGSEKRPYPWGSPFREGDANTQEEVLGRPSAVGLYVKDRTPEGVYDLAGNVAEWTCDPDPEGTRRLVHPGSWDQPSMAAWAKAKEYRGTDDRGAALGFRISRDA